MAQKPIGNVTVHVKRPAHKPKFVSSTEAEIAAGRARVQHHEDRERMVEGKRQRDDESKDVADAKAANSSL